MESKLGTLLFVVIGLLAFEHGWAIITVKPSDTEVIVGSSTYLKCSTSLPKDVNWYHYPAGTPPSNQKYVYAHHQWYSPYKERFELHKNETLGTYDLFIPKVELADAGVYACQDDDGNGETVPAELIVLKGAPTCSTTMKPDGVIGVNSCNKKPEELQLSCTVSYSGKNPPTLEWRSRDGNTSITQGLTTETADSSIISRLTLNGEPSIDGSSYVCQTSKSHFHCISSSVRIIYAIGSNEKQKAKIGDTVVCKANASQDCTYRWKWFKGDDILTVSKNQTLIPIQSGNFRCEADCFIRTEPCAITSMFAYVDGGNTTDVEADVKDSTLAPGYVALIICIIVALTAIITVVIFLAYRRNKKKRPIGKEEHHLLSSWPSNGGILAEEIERLLKAFEDESSDSHSNEFSRLIAILPYIDKGTNGEVYGPCSYKGNTCAFQRNMYSTSKLSEKDQAQIVDKGNCWKKLEHANVIEFYCLRLEVPALYILMEHAAGGTVRKALDSCDVVLPSDVATNWALQIAKGMKYLHEQNILHSHLKSAQVLIMEPFDPSKTSNNILKIASYRISTESLESSAPGSFKGMFAWESPESIQMQTFSKTRDVWSYGVTVWEIFTKEIPYRGKKNAVIIQHVMDGNKVLTIPPSCPDVLHGIIKHCWSIESENRPSFANIVSTLNDGKPNLKNIMDASVIPDVIPRLPYIDKGSSGEVFGPFIFQGKKCACERIMYSPAKVSSVTDDEICHPGKRWLELDHKHLLRFYDVCFQNPTLYVVMDFAEGGSVRRALDSCMEDLEDNVVTDWATQIADGMNYLHSKDIIHGRLKAAQVLIMEPFASSDPLRKTLKIGSYHLMIEIHEVAPSFKGMFAWMSPETIQASQNTCKASDVWSYGVTVWEMLTREIPYKSAKHAAIIKSITEGNPTLPIPSRCPKTILDILKECWIHEVDKRPTFSDILSRLHSAADC